MVCKRDGVQERTIERTIERARSSICMPSIHTGVRSVGYLSAKRVPRLGVVPVVCLSHPVFKHVSSDSYVEETAWVSFGDGDAVGSRSSGTEG